MSRVRKYLTTETVCGLLDRAGADEVTIGKVFSARLQPQVPEGEEFDYDRKFVLGVPIPAGRVMLVVYRFGKAIGPEEDHWKPQWISVEGPFALDDAKEKSKELTSD